MDTKNVYEIAWPGTDHEQLELGGLRYWLDITSDPQNSIGWVVEDANAHGAQDTCSVAEVAAVPGARDYVIQRTRDAIDQAIERNVPPPVVATLEEELADVLGEASPPQPRTSGPEES